MGIGIILIFLNINKMYTLIQKHFALIFDRYNMGHWQLIVSTIKKNTFDKKQNVLFVLMLVSYMVLIFFYIIFKV